MAKKNEKAPAQNQAQNADGATQNQPLTIAYMKKFGRWYVYFKGVRPEQNVGCPCKSAAKALNYIAILMERYDAVVAPETIESLRLEDGQTPGEMAS